MKRLAFAVPGDLDTPTGGYAYDKRIIAELRRLGFATDVVNLGDRFPWPSGETRAAALAALARIPAGRSVIIDGLAFGALPELAGDFCKTRPVIALVHHPLALETGLTAERAAQLRTSERTALAGARHVIVPSAATAAILVADYGVPRSRITAAPPGSDRIARAIGSAGAPVALLSVGALVPRKGYDTLIEALATIRDLDWRLTIAGPRDRDPATAQQIAALIARLGLDARVMLAGAVTPDRLTALYSAADLFVLASRFEGYGMAFAEAASCGLPIIGTTAGAIPDTVLPGAGLLVPPDDVEALAAALRRLIGDASERARFAEAAFAAADRLPTWEASARLIAAVVEGRNMSGFSVDWLARREPYDRRARNAAVLAAVAQSFAAYPSVTVVDLACGTGATLRAISGALPPRQSWRLIDNDLSLLARAQQAVGPEMTVRAAPLDLARDLELALDGPVDLVTTSALLDLVSGEWLERLATEIAARNLLFYAALSVDGRIAFDPLDPADETVIAAFNRHQRTDKGFGPALGPDAVPAATALFSRIGYRVMQGPSDWAFGPADALQADLVAGLGAAATEMGANRAEVADWAARRAALIEARRSSLRVGHVDFFARPTGRR